MDRVPLDVDTGQVETDLRIDGRFDRGDRVEIRVKGRGDLRTGGTIVKKLEGGTRNLPSQALGYAAGGSIRTVADDRDGLTAAERFFGFRIKPDADSSVRLRSGQLVVIRAATEPKPLAVQWFRSLLQLLQQRFQV